MHWLPFRGNPELLQPLIEKFPGGFTPQFGGTMSIDISLAGGVRGTNSIPAGIYDISAVGRPKHRGFLYLQHHQSAVAGDAQRYTDLL